MRETWPEPMTRDDAIAAVEESRAIHVEWVEHLKTCSPCQREVDRPGGAGGTAHHERAIRKYDGVLNFLRSLEPADG